LLFNLLAKPGYAAFGRLAIDDVIGALLFADCVLFVATSRGDNRCPKKLCEMNRCESG